MEQFTYLKTHTDLSETDAWDFILNVWLVWKGGRIAFLLETSNYENGAKVTQTMQTFAAGYPQTVGIVSDAAQQHGYPRWLLYNKAQAGAADVQKVQTDSDNFDALARLLRFGCIDPEYGNEDLTRYAFHLFVDADAFPEQDLIAFVCSEKVPRPTEAWLRQVATPIKQALQSTFHNVQVHWKCTVLRSLSKLVEAFAQFAKGQNDEILTAECRANFIEVLSADDAQGYHELLGVFEDGDLATYQRTVRQFAPALTALLLMRLCDVGDYMGSDPEDDSEYQARIKCAEDSIFNSMPMNK